MTNIPTQVRAVIYLLGIFINAFFGALTASGMVLSIWVVAALAGYNALMALMANANITQSK